MICCRSILLIPAALLLICMHFYSDARLKGSVIALAQAEQAGAKGQELLLGVTVAGELIVGQKHRFSFAAESNQFIKLIVAPVDFRFTLTVYGPDGEKRAECNRRYLGATPLSLVTETAGNYKAEIALTDRPNELVPYEIKLEQKHSVAEQDPIKATAEKTVRDAEASQGKAAVSKFEEALQLLDKLGDQREKAYVLVRLSNRHYYIDEYQQMLRRAAEARPIWQALNDSSGQAESLLLLGTAKFETGNLEPGLKDCLLSQELFRSANSISGQARIAVALGGFYAQAGEYSRAVDLGGQARIRYERLQNKNGLGAALTLLGNTFLRVGYYRNAADIFSQSLQLAEEAGATLQQRIAHGQLGEALLGQREIKLALEEFNKELALSTEKDPPRLKAYTFARLGQAYDALNDREKASKYYQQSLALHRQMQNPHGEAITLNRIGLLLEKGGQRQDALIYYAKALPITEATTDRGEKISALSNLARVRRDLDELDAASANAKEAIKLIESIRQEVGGRQQRSSYLARVQEAYSLYVDLLMRQREKRLAAGDAAAAADLQAEALQASDHYRARSLLDSLAEARAEIRREAPAELLKREQELQRLINVKADRQMILLRSQDEKTAEATRQKVKALDEDLRSLEVEYERLQEQMRRDAPRYAELTQPQALTSEAMKELLNEQTLLLIYSLGDQRSYLWAVTPTSVDSYQLPPRDEIEGKAREVHKWMTAEQWLDKSNFEKFVQEARRAEVRYREEAVVLSQSLLGPVAAQLGRKRLLIVGEGALQRLSFAALPQPETRRADAAVRRQKVVARSAAPPARSPVFTPLIADHEIVTLPSVSVLAAMRRDFAGRQTAPKSLAMFADPIFSGDDARLARTPGNPPQKPQERNESITESGELQQSLREIGVADIEKRFPRLWGTKTEAEYITPLVSPDSRLVMMNAEASVETVKNTDLRQYRLIHFATHGLLNNENPELSGLVFSLFNARGQRQNGFLRMHEIYNLKLGADIVVLSSCEGGDGKDVRGEGLMALTRGFFYAGAPRVVASLWTADDAATPILMREFYQQLIEKQATPAAALKAAQLAVRGRRQWHAPYYWAGFVLQGEYR